MILKNTLYPPLGTVGQRDEEAQQVRTQGPQVKEQRTNPVLLRSAGRRVLLQQNTNHHEQDERPKEEISNHEGVTRHMTIARDVVMRIKWQLSVCQRCRGGSDGVVNGCRK
jgi:hypothetical protein